MKFNACGGIAKNIGHCFFDFVFLCVSSDKLVKPQRAQRREAAQWDTKNQRTNLKGIGESACAVASPNFFNTEISKVMRNHRGDVLF